MNSRERKEFNELNRLEEISRILERRKKEFSKMHKVNIKVSKDEVVNFVPSQHQFCYSGLHW